jgi:hypothetical protein
VLTASKAFLFQDVKKVFQKFALDEPLLDDPRFMLAESDFGHNDEIDA